MSNYTTFFLNTSKSVVQLELIELAHPDLSKTYRIVRNAINGVTVTLEDATSKVFDYYPLRITPSGSSTDLEQTMEVQLGDLGSVLPQELDRLDSKPNPVLNAGCLIGAFVDAGGVVVANPFLIGLGTRVWVPGNATRLFMGMNDDFYGDNIGSWNVVINGSAPISVNGKNQPWTFAGPINLDRFWVTTGGTAPASYTIPGGVTQLVITSSGAAGLNAVFGTTDGNGNASAGVGNTPNLPGFWIVPRVGFTQKPVMKYRAYRSDDLTAPMLGPLIFQVNNIAFQKEGATLSASAPRLNLSATGELYDLDRFPTLRGFL